jgi:hypothetical protein
MHRILKIVVAASLLAIPAAAHATTESIQTTVAVAARAKGSFKQVGHNALNNRGMNAALAVRGRYAYVGSRTDGPEPDRGVYVVDVSRPSAPEVVHEIGPPQEGNEGETSREMRIWPEKDLLIVMNLGSNCSELIHWCSPRRVADNFRFYDISGKRAAKPKLVAEYKPSQNPHEFYLWDDPSRRGRALMFMSTPGSDATSLLVTDISGARKGKFKELGKTRFPMNDGSLHSLSLSPDGERATMAYLTGGFFMIDTSDFAEGARKPRFRMMTPAKNRPQWPGPGAHSAIPLFGKPYALVTDEVYGEALRALGGHGCPWGWVRMLDIRNPSRPKVKAEYKLPQNDPDFCTTDVPRPSSSYAAHNPTLTPNLALLTWHAGGLQAIDLSNPVKPKQAAEFRPEPLPFVLLEDPALSLGQDKVVMWSFPVIQDGLIYVTDVRNGLYILKYRGPHAAEVNGVDFLEGNSNLGDTMRFARR